MCAPMSSFHSVLYLFCTLEESHCCGSWSVQVERPSNTATHSSIHSISIRIIRFDSYLAQQTAPPSHDLVIYFCSDCFAVAALLHVARSAARYLNDRFDPTWEKSRAPQLTLAVQAKHWCVFVPYMCAHTQLCHTLSFTHNFHTQLSHTTFTHTIFHTQLCHTPCSFDTQHLSHTTLSHTTFFTCRSFNASFVFPSFPVPLQHLLLIIGRS